MRAELLAESFNILQYVLFVEFFDLVRNHYFGAPHHLFDEFGHLQNKLKVVVFHRFLELLLLEGDGQTGEVEELIVSE